MSHEVDSDLRRLITKELVNVPVDKWGYYFPFMIAMWRYIERRYPGVLGELKATYADEPELVGVGAEWFAGTVMNNLEILDVLDSLAYGVFDSLPRPVLKRGYAMEDELTQLDPAQIERLENLIQAEVREHRAAD